MEERAPYLTAVPPAGPKPPRNLAKPLAAWLREQGFATTEHQYEGQATVAATWTGPRGEHFQLSYVWVARYQSATMQLQARWPGLEAENLVGAQQIRRLREARWLLTGNVRYRNARLLATLPHPAL